MTDSLLRLMWALPLVLAIGVGALLLMKRHGIGVRPRSPDEVPLVMLNSLAISPHTTAFVLKLGNEEWLVLESDKAVQIQVRAPAVKPGVPGRTTPWPMGRYLS